MEKAKELFDTWLKSQEKFFESWMETAQKIPRTYWGTEIFKDGPLNPNGDGFIKLYTSWVNEMISALSNMRGLNADVIRDTLSKMTGSSNVFMKFYDIWLPISKAIQERVSDAALYKELVDPAKYKELMDKIFGFSPEAVTEFTDQVLKTSEAFGLSAKEFGVPWAKAMQKNLKKTPELFEGRPEAFLNVFHNLFAAFDNTVGKVFHIPAVGKDREKVELIMRSFDDVAVFLARNTEFQYKIYVTGIKAMEKVLESIARRIKNGDEISTFEEFFDLWIDVNEREFFEVFRTEEFSRMQGELLDAFLNVRRHFQKLMELYLFDFPVALRSEMDDLYKTVYDLKRKVRNLERQLSGVTGKEAVA